MIIGRLRAGILAGLAPWLAVAGSIRLDVTPAFDLTSTPPVLKVAVWNEGDEPARNVEIEAAAGAWSARATNAVRAIGPDENVDVTLPVTQLPAVPGVYPAVIRIRYADLNGCGFSAVHVAELAVGGEKPGVWMLASLDSVAIAGAAKLTLTMATLEEEAQEVRVRLVLPDELSCADAERKVTLPPEGDVVQTFDVVNRSGLPGSVYLVAAVMENEAGGVHRGDVATGSVRVDASAPTPLWRYLLWFGVGAGLLIVLLVTPRWTGRKP